MLFGFSDVAGAVTWARTSRKPLGDADATGVSTSRRGQVKSSARPAGADKGSPLIMTRAASASTAARGAPGPPSNWSLLAVAATSCTIGPANGRGAV